MLTIDNTFKPGTREDHDLTVAHYQVMPGLWNCKIDSKKYPYTSASACAATPEEAERLAWEIRKKIIERQLSTNGPTIVVK